MNGTHPRFPPHSVGVANLATRWHEVPLAPSLRELLSEREAEGVSWDEWYVPPAFSAPVGAARSRPPAAKPLNIHRTAQLRGVREAKSLPYGASANM